MSRNDVVFKLLKQSLLKTFIAGTCEVNCLIKECSPLSYFHLID